MTNTLVDFSQFFSIFNDLKVIGMPFQALQIVFEMQSQKTTQKKKAKKMHFFSFFFILTPPTFKPHNFFYFLFI
jgi:hypothetical protein